MSAVNPETVTARPRFTLELDVVDLEILASNIRLARVARRMAQLAGLGQEPLTDAREEKLLQMIIGALGN